MVRYHSDFNFNFFIITVFRVAVQTDTRVFFRLYKHVAYTIYFKSFVFLVY